MAYQSAPYMLKLNFTWCATGQPQVSENSRKQTAAALCKALKHSQRSLAGTAAAALGHAGLRGALPLPNAPAPAASSSTAVKSGSEDRAPDTKSPPHGNNGAPAAEHAKTSDEPPDTTATLQAAMQHIVDLTKDKDVRVVQSAATAAGYICAGHCVKAVLDPALQALFALGFNKNEDVLFTVGEALCFAFGGDDSPALFIEP